MLSSTAVWERLLAALRQVEETGEAAPAQLELIVKIVLRAWRDDPDLVRLLVREVTRNPNVAGELDEIGQALAPSTKGSSTGAGTEGRCVPMSTRALPPGCSTARSRRC